MANTKQTQSALGDFCSSHNALSGQFLTLDLLLLYYVSWFFLNGLFLCVSQCLCGFLVLFLCSFFLFVSFVLVLFVCLFVFISLFLDACLFSSEKREGHGFGGQWGGEEDLGAVGGGEPNQNICMKKSILKKRR